jgi:hypothetical protein
MSSLSDLPEVIGFFSYSREDDESFKGTLSALRDGIQRELGAQLGRSKRNFRLWQDQEAIAPGRLWETEIKTAVEQAVFFIPIVTPRAVNSEYCHFEFEAFLARERALGRTDLVFPILYIAVPALENEAQWRNHPVLSVIGQRQYVDWRQFRHLDAQATVVREAIERFCGKIVEALHQSWVSQEERRRQEEATAQQQAEATAQQQAEDEHRRLEESEAKRRAQEQESRRQAEAEASQRAEVERRGRAAEAKQRADQEKAFAAIERASATAAASEVVGAGIADENKTPREILPTREGADHNAAPGNPPASMPSTPVNCPRRWWSRTMTLFVEWMVLAICSGVVAGIVSFFVADVWTLSVGRYDIQWISFAIIWVILGALLAYLSAKKRAKERQ